MKKIIHKVSIILLFAITATASYYFGQFSGFGRGTEYQAYLSSTNRGLENTIILKNLRSGKNQVSIDLLEMILDGDIIIHRNGINSGKPPLPYSLIFPDIEESQKKIMIQVAKYRQNYPSSSSDVGVQKSVNFVVNHYLQE